MAGGRGLGRLPKRGMERKERSVRARCETATSHSNGDQVDLRDYLEQGVRLQLARSDSNKKERAR